MKTENEWESEGMMDGIKTVYCSSEPDKKGARGILRMLQSSCYSWTSRYPGISNIDTLGVGI